MWSFKVESDDSKPQPNAEKLELNIQNKIVKSIVTVTAHENKKLVTFILK